MVVVRHQLETAALFGLSVVGYNLRAVARGIFATSNSLKSHAARKLKSPFSKIRAVKVQVVLVFEANGRLKSYCR
jgi:hypothetical protein